MAAEDLQAAVPAGADEEPVASRDLDVGGPMGHGSDKRVGCGPVDGECHLVRRIRADEAEDAENKLGRSLDEIFPKADYQIMHTLLFPHDVVHIENLGGQIDEVLDQKILFGCFPWRFQGGEAALCRAVAMIE